jgi:phenylalanyl-tRNA synthetase alpha chain
VNIIRLLVKKRAAQARPIRVVPREYLPVPKWTGICFFKEARMLPKLHEILTNALEELEKVHDTESLERWRVARLGRNSPLMQIFDQMGMLPKEERPAVGKSANELKRALETALTKKLELMRQASLQRSLETEKLDVTLPGRPKARGHLHPNTLTMREIIRVFGEMGFQVYRTREVETDEYNFELLNIPAHHPARDMWDTFHTTTPGVLLRTHTSPGQIYVMRRYVPQPLRVILPGMCYRYEQVSARKDIQFTQVEGLVVDHNITMADLKGMLNEFFRRLFGENVRTRFRASYFPFTEPSGELDVECFICGGKGCGVCSGTGWLEMLGCGMVHPIVLLNGGYDPEQFSGFAFGMGPERTTMLRYRIADIRDLWSNDLRFLEQF